jgi:cyclopropane-fatty-acyl-phospholipid synthase
MSLAHEPSLAVLAAHPREFRRLPALAGAPAAFRFAALVLARNWVVGKLTFVMPSGRELKLEGQRPGTDARIIIRDFRFMRRVLAAGDIGFAEGYMAKEWDTPDLAAVLHAMSLNADRIKRLLLGNPVSWAKNLISHAMNANTRAGSKKNIHAHYDLGNAFYGRWLDRTMTYSSALFEDANRDLAAAQTAKYRALAKSMDLQAGHSVLEIGCGWGGFAEFAAREVGAKVTGVTISQEQFDFARKRIADQGLSDRVDLKLIDYRDVTGQFDRIASIEMFEAVGERYWPTYFGKVRDLLKPGGRAGLQIITIRDEFFATYRRRADFIQKYILPGGMLPSEKKLKEQTNRASLGWTGIRRFGQDYADTLSQWGHRFESAWDDIAKLGFDERFRRLWLFYLAYCEAGFRSGRTDVVQLGLAKG